MSEHTKGPWRKVDRLNNSDSSNNDKSCGIEGGEDDFIVAEVCGDVHEHEANAHLIAAAPELLEALKPLAAFLDAYEQMTGLSQEEIYSVINGKVGERKLTVAMFQAARAAIAKAEGKC